MDVFRPSNDRLPDICDIVNDTIDEIVDNILPGIMTPWCKCLSNNILDCFYWI